MDARKKLGWSIARNLPGLIPAGEGVGIEPTCGQAEPQSHQALLLLAGEAW